MCVRARTVLLAVAAGQLALAVFVAAAAGGRALASAGATGWLLLLVDGLVWGQLTLLVVHSVLEDRKEKAREKADRISAGGSAPLLVAPTVTVPGPTTAVDSGRNRKPDEVQVPVPHILRSSDHDKPPSSSSQQQHHGQMPPPVSNPLAKA